MNIIGEQISIYYDGAHYRFEYVGNGEWKCLNDTIIPGEVRKILADLTK